MCRIARQTRLETISPQDQNLKEKKIELSGAAVTGTHLLARILDRGLNADQ